MATKPFRTGVMALALGMVHLVDLPSMYFSRAWSRRRPLVVAAGRAGIASPVIWLKVVAGTGSL